MNRAILNLRVEFMVDGALGAEKEEVDKKINIILAAIRTTQSRTWVNHSVTYTNDEDQYFSRKGKEDQ